MKFFMFGEDMLLREEAGDGTGGEAAAAGDDTGDGTGGEAAEEAKKKGDEETGAPEKYEAFTLDKEYAGLINDATMEQFSVVAKDLNLTQAEAQKLVDYEVQRQEQMFDAYTDQTNQWSEDVKTDKEIGGADHELKLAVVAKSFKLLATDEFRTLMNPYHPVDNPTGLGLGNHPEVVRLFYRIGLKMSEDGLVLSDGSGKETLSREAVMYGKKET